MIPGAPKEARWITSRSRTALAAPDLDRIVERAFGQSRGHTMRVQPLTDGFRNANYRLQFNGGSDLFVVRIYEHDATLCKKG